MIKNLGETNSVLNRFISELRNIDIQNDRMRFRRNLERIGEIFAYEISKTLSYSVNSVTTPLGIADMQIPAEEPVLATIMRAGLPFQNGFLNFFDNAENAFISAYRKYNKDGSFTIQFEHLSCPPIDGKTIILNDVMMASGSSFVLSYQALLGKGMPRHTHMVSIIASKEGISYVKRHLPMKNITLWVGAIDDELTVKGYIVPGLGDAGDLAFGDK
jgi:uracil phosphoribosyltransferase